MGISQRQGPIHVFSPATKAYKDNYDNIFRKQKEEIDEAKYTTGTPLFRQRIKRATIADIAKKLLIKRYSTYTPANKAWVTRRLKNYNP